MNILHYSHYAKSTKQDESHVECEERITAALDVVGKEQE